MGLQDPLHANGAGFLYQCFDKQKATHRCAAFPPIRMSGDLFYITAFKIAIRLLPITLSNSRSNTNLGFCCESTAPLKPLARITTKNNCTIWAGVEPFCSTIMAAMPPMQLCTMTARALKPMNPLIYPSKFF